MNFYVATFRNGDSMCLWAIDERQARVLLVGGGAGLPERIEQHEPSEFDEYRGWTAPPERPHVCGWHLHGPTPLAARRRAQMDALVSYANVGALLVAVDDFLPGWQEAVRLVVAQRVLEKPRLLDGLLASARATVLAQESS